MSLSLRLCAVLVLTCAFEACCSAQVSPFETDYKAGIAAFEKSEYQKAIDPLQRAVLASPESVSAHLYLAKAYNEIYCRGCEFDSDPDAVANGRWRTLAIDFEKVLTLDKSNTEALNSIADLYRWYSKWDDAERYYRRAIEADSMNVEALYSVAHIDWLRSWKTRMEKRAELNISRRQKLITRSACKDIRAKNVDRVNEGILLLSRAVQIQDVLEPMAYLSLLYRERADIQCGDEAAYRDDVANANSWESRACAAAARNNRMILPHWYPPPPPPPSGEECRK